MLEQNGGGGVEGGKCKWWREDKSRSRLTISIAVNLAARRKTGSWTGCSAPQGCRLYRLTLPQEPEVIRRREGRVSDSQSDHITATRKCLSASRERRRLKRVKRGCDTKSNEWGRLKEDEGETLLDESLSRWNENTSGDCFVFFLFLFKENSPNTSGVRILNKGKLFHSVGNMTAN